MRGANQLRVQGSAREKLRTPLPTTLGADARRPSPWNRTFTFHREGS